MALNYVLKNKTKIGQMIKCCSKLRQRSVDTDIFHIQQREILKNKPNANVKQTCFCISFPYASLQD